MKFSRFLELMRQNSTPDREELRRRVIKSASPLWARKVALVCAIVIAISTVAAGGLAAVIMMPRGKECNIPESLIGISPINAVTAEYADGNIIDIFKGGFEVTTAKNIKTDELSQILEISPADDYKIKRKSGNTFEITLDGGLKGNTLYTLKSIAAGKEVYSWAFQTANKFGISATSNAGGYSDLTSSVWVDFTHSDVENFEECFSISPAISGTFEHYGKRWVFIPSSEFSPSTVYTVTISKNVSGNDQTLDADHTFSFTARADNHAEYDYLNYSTKCETFSYEQVPAARFKAVALDTSSAFVSVYSIADADEFIRLHKTYVTDSMISGAIEGELGTPMLTFDTVPYPQGETYHFSYPQTFSEGYYVSVINVSGIKVYHIFQVTRSAIYSVASNGGCTVWANDLNTQLPLAGVAVTDTDGTIAATDANGIATLGSIAEDGLRYIKVGTSVPYVCITQNSVKDDYTDTALRYYSYLNTNAKVYRKGDAVKVWGFTLPRLSSIEELKEISLYCSWTDETVTVKPDINGAFTTDFILSDSIADDSGYIDLVIDGITVSTACFAIDDYKLPTYNLQITTDKKCYIQGETVTYTVYAELFDKTPAENVTVLSNGEAVTTNSRGIATITETAVAADDNAGTPYYASREFSVYQPDGESLFYYADYAVFKSQLFVSNITDDGENLNISINAVDSTKENFTGEAADSEVTVELHAVTYEADGQNGIFNPVTMQVESTTSFNRIDWIVSRETYITQGGNISVPYVRAQDGNDYYYLIICGQNEYRHYLSGDNADDFYRNDLEYSFKGADEFETGDTVSLTLDSDTVDGRVFISVIAGDIITNEVFTPDSIAFEFKDEYCPDAYVAGAYFDGDRVVPIALKHISQKNTQLNIDIQPEKDVYTPGETVGVNISVTDGDGRPIKATLNINVSDKALDTLAPDYSDITDHVRFSRANISLIQRTVSTYLPYSLTEVYGEGGAGEYRVRTDFEDTPFYDCVTTDAGGKARVTFTLPDSITSWVIRARGFTQNASVGQAKTEISATKNMFLTSYISDTVMINDDLTFALRFNGIGGEAECSYTAVLSKDGIQLETIEGTALYNQVKNECFKAAVYGEGHYKIQITGTDGMYSDSIEKEFDVVTNTAQDVITQRAQVDDGINADAFCSDVTVNICDEQYDFYYTVIETMLQKTSSRIDHKLARAAANAALGGNTDVISKEDAIQITQYVTDNGISIYSSDSYTTVTQTALITAVAGKYLDLDTLKMYFDTVAENYPDTLNTIACQLAYASMGQSVLSELNILKADIDSYSDEERLYLALAYAYAGDHATSQSIFDNYLAIRIITANGTAKFDADTTYESEYLTCIAAVLSSKLSNSSAKELIKGLLTNKDGYAVSGIALCAFIESFIPALEGENSVIYTKADGTRETIVYSRISCATVKVPYADIGKVSFSSQDGESVMTVSGESTIDKMGDIMVPSEVGAVTVTPNVNTANGGETVTLTVTIDTAGSEMALPYAKLSLPHGLKLIHSDVVAGDGYCTATSDPTKAEIYLTGESVTLTLECYAALEGAYTIHAPTVIDKASGQYLTGNTVLFTIQ